MSSNPGTFQGRSWARPGPRKRQSWRAIHMPQTNSRSWICARTRESRTTPRRNANGNDDEHNNNAQSNEPKNYHEQEEDTNHARGTTGRLRWQTPRSRNGFIFASRGGPRTATTRWRTTSYGMEEMNCSSIQ
eukprot:680296-Pyramimonas_sp.AAC.1